jgi:dienelactone hydrolase
MRYARSPFIAMIALAAPVAQAWEDTPRLRANYLSFPVEWNGRTVSLGGRLQTPLEVTGKMPAVIMLHNGSGVNYRGLYYAAGLNAAGIATFEIDQYGGRGIAAGGAKPTEVLADAGGAYQLLAGRPEIDAERIGLTGMSYGGVQTMLLMTRRYSDAAFGVGKNLKAAVALYPVCFRFNHVPGFEFKNLVGPVRIFVGTEDDLDDGQGACQELIASLRAADATQVSLRTFADATHAFDGFDGSAEVKDPLAHRGKGGNMRIRPNPEAREQARADLVHFFATALK